MSVRELAEARMARAKAKMTAAATAALQGTSDAEQLAAEALGELEAARAELARIDAAEQ